MTRFETLRHQSVADFSMVAHAPRLLVTLSSSYIAKGRVLSESEIEVWVLDSSEIAERMRTQPSIDFQIDSEGGIQLQGEALVQHLASQIGNGQKRYVLMRLCLIEANVVEGPVSPVLSLT